MMTSIGYRAIFSAPFSGKNRSVQTLKPRPVSMKDSVGFGMSSGGKSPLPPLNPEEQENPPVLPVQEPSAPRPNTSSPDQTDELLTTGISKIQLPHDVQREVDQKK
jgi:hypothetical protein